MTKQSLYKKIKIIVESWNIAITKDIEWFIMLWSSISETPPANRFPPERIRCSRASLCIDTCFYSLWVQEFWFTDVDNWKWVKYIWIYERPLRIPKVGQKVQILPKWLKLNNYSDRRKDIAWWSLEVFWLKDWICIIKCTEYDYLEVPYDCIAPRVEINDEAEESDKNICERCARDCQWVLCVSCVDWNLQL